MNDVKPKFEGVEIVLGQRTCILPPLNFRQMRKFEEKVRTYQGKSVSDIQKNATLFDVLELTPMIHAALSRNYPEITLEEVEEGFGIESVRNGKFMAAVLALFDLTGIATGGKQGEAQAVAK